MIEIKLKAKEERRLNAGHWWIFSNEIDGLDTSIEPGTLVRVLSHEGKQVGHGYFNPHSLIAVRLLQKGEGELPEDFVFENLDNAYTYRKEIGVRKYGRMCYGEADHMPGLVVDRYGDTLVVDVLTAGMEKLKPQITKALQKIFKPTGIYYKNDSAFRALEGLTNTPEIVGEVPDEVEIEENGVKYLVPLRGGQKTGFYFDQRENRRLVWHYRCACRCYASVGVRFLRRGGRIRQKERRTQWAKRQRGFSPRRCRAFAFCLEKRRTTRPARYDFTRSARICKKPQSTSASGGLVRQTRQNGARGDEAGQLLGVFYVLAPYFA